MSAASWRGGVLGVGALAVLLALATPDTASAQKGVALVIAGASGGEKYAEQSKRWRQDIAAALKERYKFGAVTVLGDETADDVPRATAAEVRKAFAAAKAQVTKDDLLLVVLLRHDYSVISLLRKNLLARGGQAPAVVARVH